MATISQHVTWWHRPTGRRSFPTIERRALTEPHFHEKFIAFVDVLGWRSLVRRAEEGQDLTLAELTEILNALGTQKDRKQYETYGPTTCPEAPRIRDDLAFQISQASDCAVVSSEISPAGVINLISHCWKACTTLLTKGIMCRGYIKRGQIYHTEQQQIGTGLSDVVEREKVVSIFKMDSDERGTPFIEIDRDVIQYVEHQPDECVKEMFSRMVRQEGDVGAIFPFQRLNHQLNLGGFGLEFDPERERDSVNNMRSCIRSMRKQVELNVDPSNESARRKGAHYIRILDTQLVACDKTEEAIQLLMQPFPSGRFD